MMLSSPKLYLLLALVSLGACGLFGNDEDQPKTVFSSGQATALLNGESWEGNARAGINVIDRLTVVFNTKDVAWPRIESFGLPTEFFHGEGVYPQYERFSPELGFTVGALFSIRDDDLILTQYHPTEDTTNHMVVTRYDSLAGVLEGTFEVTLVISPEDPPDVLLPDTLRFTDGQFHIDNLEDRRKEEE